MILSMVFMGCALGNVMQARRPAVPAVPATPAPLPPKPAVASGLVQCTKSSPRRPELGRPAAAAPRQPAAAMPPRRGSLQARGALALIVDGVWYVRLPPQHARLPSQRARRMHAHACGAASHARMPNMHACALQPSAAPSHASRTRRLHPRPYSPHDSRWFFWLGCAAALSNDLSTWSWLGLGGSSKSRLQAAVAFSWLTW